MFSHHNLNDDVNNNINAVDDDNINDNVCERREHLPGEVEVKLKSHCQGEVVWVVAHMLSFQFWLSLS